MIKKVGKREFEAGNQTADNAGYPSRRKHCKERGLAVLLVVVTASNEDAVLSDHAVALDNRGSRK